MATVYINIYVSLDIHREEGESSSNNGGKDVVLFERKDLGHWPYLEDPMEARAAMKRFFITDDGGGGRRGAGQNRVATMSAKL